MAAHWMDGEPISDGVAIMAAIEDRYRSYVVDGDPVVTGVVAVGDSWSCTNPSLGRGTSIGILHAKALRDVLREIDTADHELLVRRFDELTRNEIEPWYRRTLSFDRHRLAEIEADIAGHPYETDDPVWQITKAWTVASTVDSEVYRTYVPLLALQSTPEEELAAPGLLDRIIAASAGLPQYPDPGPDRAALLTGDRRIADGDDAHRHQRRHPRSRRGWRRRATRQCCCCTAGPIRTPCGDTRSAPWSTPATGRSLPTCAASGTATSPRRSTPTACSTSPPTSPAYSTTSPSSGST